MITIYIHKYISFFYFSLTNYKIKIYFSYTVNAGNIIIIMLVIIQIEGKKTV